jgi:hypothetical protein
VGCPKFRIEGRPIALVQPIDVLKSRGKEEDVAELEARIQMRILSAENFVAGAPDAPGHHRDLAWESDSTVSSFGDAKPAFSPSLDE